MNNTTTLKKNCPWRPYLLAEWDEMKKLNRGSYIDVFCQVWFQLAQLFQRSILKYEKVNGRTDDGCQVMAIRHMTLWVGWTKKRVNSGRVRCSCSTLWHPSYYFCYKSGDKSFIWKGSDCDYDKRNILVFIDDADIMQLLTRSWWQS